MGGTTHQMNGVPVHFHGKTIFVDSVTGSDANGTRQDAWRPFATIGAALAAASSGDLVFIRPGTYSESIIIPAGVAVRGASTKAVTIQRLLVTADTTLVTMGVNTRLEDVSMLLTSAEHHTLTGIHFPSGTTSTAKVRTAVLTVDNSTADVGGTSNVYGIRSVGNGFPASGVDALRAVTVTVRSTGAGGAKRALLVDTSAHGFGSRDVNFVCTRVAGAGGTYYGVETNFAGVVADIRVGSISGTDADISQTLGTLMVAGVELTSNSANGLAFASGRPAPSYLWCDAAGVQPGTRYLHPGTANASVSEFQIAVAQKLLLRNLQLRAAVAPGVGHTDTVTVRKNGVATTLTANLVDAATTAADNAHSVSFAAGDLLSIEIVSGAGSALSDLAVAVETY